MRISFIQACNLLKSEHVVAIPTETVYGLAASIASHKAIEEIFFLKGRPANNPLIVHLSSINELDQYAKTLPQDCQKLAKAFWPGPLTIVVPVLLDKVPEMVRAGLSTAAFRVPGHPLAKKMLEHTGPLVMPSANLSGRPSATCVEHVEADFGKLFPILDGGVCAKGVESTILFWQNDAWTIIRLGALAPEDFYSVLGYLPSVNVHKGSPQPLCPGQLFRHYAPRARLKLIKDPSTISSGVVVGFSNRRYPRHCRVFSLGSSHKPSFVMQHLYAVLRQLDQEDIEEAYVDINLPNEGLWLTLKERLFKASQAEE